MLSVDSLLEEMALDVGEVAGKVKIFIKHFPCAHYISNLMDGFVAECKLEECWRLLL